MDDDDADYPLYADADYPLYDDADADSADDDFGDVYGYDDEMFGGEDDEIYDGSQDSDPVEEEVHEIAAAEEEEHGDDQMIDFPEDEELVEEEEEQSEEEEEEKEEEEDGEEFEIEAEAEEEMEEGGEEEVMEEVLVEEYEEEVVYGEGAGYWDGDNDNPLLLGTEYEEDPFDAPWLDDVAVEPCPPTHLRYIYSESESSEFGGDERGIDSSDSDSSTERLTLDARVESQRINSCEIHDSTWEGFRGPICSICYERWTEETEHCVCCLPCGHIYGMSCIQKWLKRPDSQKCPQCNEACELEDVKRLYGMQLATPNEEELQQKVETLEAKCVNLETKDADWMRKEAAWQKREADLQQQLNQHIQAEDMVKDTSIQGDASVRRDLVDDSEPTNAVKNR